MRLSLGLLGIVAVSACSSPPAMTEFNGHTVTIQQVGYDYFPDTAQAEADRVCGTVGKTAQAESMRPDERPGLVAPIMNYLYLCV
jgi:hypothetical protein